MENVLDVDGKLHYSSDCYFDTAYGISIQLSDEITDFVKNTKARHIAEVAVFYKNEVREFTLDNFLDILGFKR
jgi:hypothetical protein